MARGLRTEPLSYLMIEYLIPGGVCLLMHSCSNVWLPPLISCLIACFWITSPCLFVFFCRFVVDAVLSSETLVLFVEAGGSGNFTARLQQGFPEIDNIRLEWLATEDAALPSDGRFSLSSENFSLAFQNVKASDTGVYTLAVTNSNIKRLSFNLTVITRRESFNCHPMISTN